MIDDDHTPPPRLLEDPEVGRDLFDDLSTVKLLPPTPYDMESGLTQLRAHLQSAEPDESVQGSGPVEESPSSVAPKLMHTVKWWGATATGAVALTAAALVVLGGDLVGYASNLPRVLRSAQAEARVEPMSEWQQVPAPPVGATSQPSALEFDEPGLDSPSGDAEGLARREMQQLAEARRAMAREPARALKLVRASQREFPEGMFIEERAALVVFALEALGQHVQAKAEGRRFLQRYASSPFRARVRRILARAR